MQGRTVRIFTLARDQAEQFSKQTLWGRARWLISSACVVAADGKTAGDECRLYTRQPEIDLLVFPPPDAPLLTSGEPVPPNRVGLFAQYQLSLPLQSAPVTIDLLSPDKAVVQLPPDLLRGVDNLYLRIDYAGDIGSCYVDGQLVADNFHNGTIWEIGLKQILCERAAPELYFLITPTRRNVKQAIVASSAMAFIPGSADIGVAAIQTIEAVPEYRASLTVSD